METLKLDRAIAAHFVCAITALPSVRAIAALSPSLWLCYRSTCRFSCSGLAPVLSQHFHLNVWLCYRSTLFRAAPVLSQQFNYFGCAIAALYSGLPLCYRSISINRRIFGCAIAALCYGAIAARN